MKQKIKYNQLLTIFSSLKKLGEGKSKVWFSIAQNQQRALSALKSYEEEYKVVKEQIVNNLAEKNTDGSIKTKKIIDNNGNEVEIYEFGNNTLEANKLVFELENKEIEVDFLKIKLSDLNEEENIANVIISLLDVIIEE